MKTTIIGFSSVICGGIVLCPLLVQTDLTPVQPPVASTAVQREVVACSEAIDGVHVVRPEARRPRAQSGCTHPPGLIIAQAP